MIKDSAPKKTPKPASGVNSKQDKSARLVFMGSVIDMSWQLAFVVLIPLIGGYKLDEHFKTSPLWIIVGTLVALFGVVAVMRRLLGGLNQSFFNPGDKK